MLRSSLSGEITFYKTLFLERRPENLVRGGEDNGGKRSNVDCVELTFSCAEFTFLDFSLLRLASLI